MLGSDNGEDAITIPRAHVPFGPQCIDSDTADAASYAARPGI